jgi:hypothetical protein
MLVSRQGSRPKTMASVQESPHEDEKVEIKVIETLPHSQTESTHTYSGGRRAHTANNLHV